MGAKELLPLAQTLWRSWGIQGLVLASFLFQVILAILGRRRKYMNYFFLELIIWGSYLLAQHIATLAIGKLTQVSVRSDEFPAYNVMLKGLLAPLLLMHYSHPDSMTAYSVEDSRLGIRQMVNLAVNLSFVIWVVISCWDITSPVSWLLIPLFLGGMIKSATTVLALKSVYDDSISAKEIDVDKNKPAIDEREFGIKPSPLGIILMAYYRFNCLRPHLDNWLYQPNFVSRPWMLIDELSPVDAFTVTEVELSFMFDVLYSKAPILYTKLGLVGRFFSFLCLVATLVGFSVLFRNAFLLDMYVTYTYGLLIGSTLIELYQIVLLPISDWAIVQMCTSPKKLIVSNVRHFMVSICSKQKRWSGNMEQLNLMQYSMNSHPPKLLKLIAKLLNQEEQLERYWVSTAKIVTKQLKEVLFNDIKKLEDRRQLSPFTKRGQWTLETFNIKGKKLSSTFEIAFDKSIIIWHIATNIWIESDRENSKWIESDSEKSKYYRASELLSNYMMYLLARHPYMLSVTTADITLGYASSVLKHIPKKKGFSGQLATLLLEYIQNHEGNMLEVEEIKPETISYGDTMITRDWNFLGDVQKLEVELRALSELSAPNDKWKFICSVWVELLCYAAYNCQVYDHAEMLRRGGELITHVWLLLAHKTDKFQSRSESRKNSEEEPQK